MDLCDGLNLALGEAERDSIGCDDENSSQPSLSWSKKLERSISLPLLFA